MYLKPIHNLCTTPLSFALEFIIIPPTLIINAKTWWIIASPVSTANFLAKTKLAVEAGNESR